jgi:hypothetical protein
LSLPEIVITSAGFGARDLLLVEAAKKQISRYVRDDKPMHRKRLARAR